MSPREQFNELIAKYNDLNNKIAALQKDQYDLGDLSNSLIAQIILSENMLNLTSWTLKYSPSGLALVADDYKALSSLHELLSTGGSLPFVEEIILISNEVQLMEFNNSIYLSFNSSEDIINFVTNFKLKVVSSDLSDKMDEVTNIQNLIENFKMPEAELKEIQ